MAVKCTECGASIQDDSKFCKYCGAKVLDENLKKIEVRIDNTAEIKRAGYEEQESLLRQERMKRELQKEKRKPYVIAAKALTVAVPLAVCFFVKSSPLLMLSFLIVGCLFFMLWLYLLLSKR